MNSPPLLFISGIPATGKSHFGQWLESQHSYLHIDPENPTRTIDHFGLRTTWDKCWPRWDCSAFIAALRNLGHPVVFNWGYPPTNLPLAIALIQSGFSSWWFDGDVTAARAEFVRIGKDVRFFDKQIANIRSIQDQIEEIYRGRTIPALNSAGERMEPESIFRMICNTAA